MEKTDNFKDLIGTTVGVLDEEGHEYKKITVKNYKQLGDQIVWTDENGDIYSDDELNWSYQLTPRGIFCYIILSHIGDITEEELDEMWDDFENSMKRNGYVKE